MNIVAHCEESVAPVQGWLQDALKDPPKLFTCTPCLNVADVEHFTPVALSLLDFKGIEVISAIGTLTAAPLLVAIPENAILKHLREVQAAYGSLFNPVATDDKPLLTGVGWPGILERLAAVADAEHFPPSVLAMARAAVNIIGRTVYLLPTLSDGSDDDLSLFWRYHDVEASLSFEREGGVVGYAFRAGSKGPWIYEGTSISAAALQPLISALTAI